MEQRLELTLKGHIRDVAGEQLQEKVKKALGIEASCRLIDAFNFGQPVPAEDMGILASDVFSDSVVQDYSFREPIHPDCWRIEVGFLPGVTDNVGHTASEAVKDRLGKELEIYHSTVYAIKGPVDELMCDG